MGRIIDISARPFQARLIDNEEVTRNGLGHEKESDFPADGRSGGVEMAAGRVSRAIVCGRVVGAMRMFLGSGREFFARMQQLAAGHQKKDQHPENPDMPQAKAHWF